MSSVAARFFPPQIAGAGATVAPERHLSLPHRPRREVQPDHPPAISDSPARLRGPWFGFNWRYDSGLVAGAVPCYNVSDPNSACDGTSTTAQRPARGRPQRPHRRPGVPGRPHLQRCQGHADHGRCRTTCLASQYTSNLVTIPAPSTEDDDHNPPRIAPRNLFDASIGAGQPLPRRQTTSGASASPPSTSPTSTRSTTSSPPSAARTTSRRER